MNLGRVAGAVASLVAACLVALAAPGCGGGSPSGTTRSVRVFAAASLRGAFDELGVAFAASHPGARVTFTYGASSDLVRQVAEGAAADVFASADEANMTKLAAAGQTAGAARVLATNSLAIAVGRGNPRHIGSLADLAQPGLIYVTCAPSVPIGAYAAQVLARAGVTVHAASLEQSVTAIVTKVASGEADAGLVYRTDVLAAAGSLDGVEIPASSNVVARYPITLTKSAAVDAVTRAAAQAFVDFALGEQGQRVLRDKGFGAP